jgi:hypothetical protein
VVTVFLVASVFFESDFLAGAEPDAFFGGLTGRAHPEVRTHYRCSRSSVCPPPAGRGWATIASPYRCGNIHGARVSSSTRDFAPSETPTRSLPRQRIRCGPCRTPPVPRRRTRR